MTDKNIVLDLRFVVLDNAVLIEVLALDTDGLGAEGSDYSTCVFKDGEGLSINLRNSYSFSVDNEGVELGCECVGETAFCRNLKFEWLKELFDNFAANNAFHSISEPPTERIEFDADKGGSRFYFDGGNSPLFPLTTAERLKEIIGERFTIYEPQQPAQRFESEWIQEVPRQFTINDLPQTLSLPSLNDQPKSVNLANLVSADIVNQCVSALNEANQQSPVQVHRFRMWEKE